MEWLEQHTPHAVLAITAAVLVGLGLTVLFNPGPIVAAVTFGLPWLSHLYAVLLIGGGVAPLAALGCRSRKWFVRTSGYMTVLYVFVLVTRVTVVGLASSNVLLLAGYVLLVVVCRLRLWDQYRHRD